MSKVVDADRINFKDFVDEVVETNPHGYGELVKVYYWALDTKVNIELCTDQDLLHMFKNTVFPNVASLPLHITSQVMVPLRFHFGTLVLLPSLLKPHSPLQLVIQA